MEEFNKRKKKIGQRKQEKEDYNIWKEGKMEEG